MSINPDTAAIYVQIRDERGWSWDQMADEFDKNASPDLAEWARSKSPEDVATEPVEPVTEVPVEQPPVQSYGQPAAE